MIPEKTSRISSPFKSMDRSLKLFLVATILEGFIFFRVDAFFQPVYLGKWIQPRFTLRK